METERICEFREGRYIKMMNKLENCRARSIVLQRYIFYASLDLMI